MIRLINNISAYPILADAMFRNRFEMFHQRLGWDVTVDANGYERDRFDDLSPIYVVSVNPETQTYQGSLRLLPTTGPNMLRDVFPQLLAEGEKIESSTIWEASRMCAIINPNAQRGDNGISMTLLEIIGGIAEICEIAKLEKIVTVVDAMMLRVLQQTPAPLELIGKPQKIGRVKAYAALLSRDPERLAKGLAQYGYGNSVFAPGEREGFAALLRWVS